MVRWILNVWWIHVKVGTCFSSCFEWRWLIETFTFFRKPLSVFVWQSHLNLGRRQTGLVHPVSLLSCPLMLDKMWRMWWQEPLTLYLLHSAVLTHRQPGYQSVGSSWLHSLCRPVISLVIYSGIYHHIVGEQKEQKDVFVSPCCINYLSLTETWECPMCIQTPLYCIFPAQPMLLFALFPHGHNLNKANHVPDSW